ncbi:hypothetical protein J4442_03710 [Candidatus Woesearchaeota archaeon]|nr:hypothetical protein [Candidatus Woesearchaeota archaeon]
MKLYKFLPLVFLLLVFLDNSEAICCDSGCSPSANVCCTPQGGGPSVGYVGCYDATTSQYVCPGTAIGECLACALNSCQPSSECSWDAQISGVCNGCEVTYNNDDFPVNSQCTASCPSGKTKCADGTCQVDCATPPSCLNTNDGCCNPSSDLICDPNCLVSQDSDCTPPEVTCTPSNGNCCVPNNDGICDSDCVSGLDPNCQPPGSNLNDGICNANSDGVCDINCVQNVDTPDCNSFAYTPSPNDGCFPLSDEVCDLDCPLDLDIDCSLPSGNPSCVNNGVCEDFEGCNCNDCIENPVNACVSGLFCCSGICSGDLDNDLICDALDYCVNIFTENDDPDDQLDADNDCYVNSKKSGLFGFCGDQCEQVDTCFDVYGSRQCCDDLAGSSGNGAFHGFTEDCPTVDETSLGCWDSCISSDSDGNIITYKIGQCIDGSRTVTKLLNNLPIETSEEPCTSIPLIPFFTNLSIVSTFLILIVYYIKRK